MPAGLFISGTDTDVGKTVITAGLARLARRVGMRPGVMKPVASGCSLQNGELVSADTLHLIAASGSKQPPGEVTPFAFREPLSPHIAARMEGQDLRGAEVVHRTREVMARIMDIHDPVLVEGVGGLLVPLTDDLLVADLCVALDLPLLVVAANRLGVISHTLLTLEAAYRRDIPVLAVVLNGGEPGDPAASSNADALRAVTDVPVVGPLPRMASPVDFDEAADALKTLGAESWLHERRDTK